jgi:hypothetical protein
MKIFYIIILIFFSFVLSYCKKNKGYNLSFDNSKSVIKLIGNISDSSKLSFRKGNIKIEFGNLNYFCRYSNNKSSNIISSNDIEIEYQVVEYDDKYNISPPRFITKNVFIGISKTEKYYKGFVIIWQNNQFIDYGKTRESLNISENTDSIFTNLDYTKINQFFPDFNGIYHFVEIDTISVNVEFPINTNEFYHNIKFDNKRIGMPIFFPDYRKIVDFFKL